MALAATTVISKQGDMLDYLVWKHHGKTEGHLEKVPTTPGTISASRDAIPWPRRGDGQARQRDLPITDMQRQLLPDPAPRKVEFTIEFVHYG